MDEIKTGVFEVRTDRNPYWKDWQLDLAKKELKRRAREATNKIMRDGVPYTVCLYPTTERDKMLVLVGLCVLSQYQDCEIGEATVRDWKTRCDRIKDYDGRAFEPEAHTDKHSGPIYIYRRVL